MALDEPQEKDFTVTDRGVTFAVETDLFEKAKPICIDFVESVRGSGFQITSSLAAGGGCGDSCAC
jgi:Fe-S cluster assembly iron-binding protein IscA